MSEPPGAVWDAICDALIHERDKHPRLPNDADSDDLTDAVLDAINAAGYDLVRRQPPPSAPKPEEGNDV